MAARLVQQKVAMMADNWVAHLGEMKAQSTADYLVVLKGAKRVEPTAGSWVERLVAV